MNIFRAGRRATAWLICAGLAGPSMGSIAPDIAETASTEDIAKATTEPRFSSPWVDYVPASASVPSPRVFFGRIAGASGELVRSGEAYAYVDALAKTSPRVRTFRIGRSEEGRDILLMAIADEAAINALDALKEASAKLADPRQVSPNELDELIARARPFYYFNAGLHSDETGSTESMLELAYRLAVSETPMIQRIRNSLVVLINPVSNPDGRDKQVDWFYRYLKGKTDRATLPRGAPPYWSRYAYVDINRDAHQQVHETTKAIHRMFHEWHPLVVHDLHESVPLLMTWNGTGPYNPNIDPITYSEFLSFSFHEVQTMTGLGMPGVSTWNFGEGFAHEFTDSVAMNHNAIGRGYETFGNGSAETMQVQLPPEDTSREWYRLMPPPAKFLWSARDNVNYNETGALAALDYAAVNAKGLLRNFYTKGLHGIERGRAAPPYAFAIDADQGDPLRVAQMVERLIAQRIEVSRSTTPIRLTEGEFASGTYFVKLDQPYRNYAVDLLTPQQYPKDGGEPYDDVSWELPANFHLLATAIADAAIKQASLTLIRERPSVHATADPRGPFFVIKDTGQESLLQARFVLTKTAIDVAQRSFEANGLSYPAGSWLFRARPSERALDELALLGVSIESLPASPPVATHAAPVPHIGVWVPWADTDSIGWLRYVLDQRKIPYRYVRDEDIRGGKLGGLDVLIYGHVDLELAEQIHGISKAGGPMPFKKTAATPSFGTPAQSEDITGGIGWEGTAKLESFVEHGGLLITLGSGSMLALEGGLVRGVRNDSGGVPRSSQGGGSEAAGSAQNAVTRTPGAHVRVSFAQPNHPLSFGYPSSTYVFRQNFPLYATPRRWLRAAYCTTCLDGPEDESGVVLKWGGGDSDREPFVVSGQAWGEANLIGRPAILDMPVGHGHVIAFNFNPVHRDMNRGDQRLLWNALINWQAIVRGER